MTKFTIFFLTFIPYQRSLRVIILNKIVVVYIIAVVIKLFFYMLCWPLSEPFRPMDTGPISQLI